MRICHGMPLTLLHEILGVHQHKDLLVRCVAECVSQVLNLLTGGLLHVECIQVRFAFLEGHGDGEEDLAPSLDDGLVLRIVQAKVGGKPRRVQRFEGRTGFNRLSGP